MRHYQLVVVLLLSSLATGSARAQAAPDPQLSLEDVETRARGMTEEELETWVKAWQEVVREKEAEVVAASDAVEDARGEDKKSLRQDFLKRLEERGVLVAKFEAAVAAYKRKAGSEKAAPYERFAKDLPAHLDLKDPGAIWAWARRWVTSSEGGIKWLWNIAAFLAILVAARIAARIAARLMRRALSSPQVKTSSLLKDFAVNTTRKVIFFLGAVIALGELGVDIGPLLAGIGAVGFIVAFALQGTLSNFAAGLMILLYRPYDIGDVIDGAGVTGKVSAMSLVSTTLLTPDNRKVFIPNSSIWGDVITNVTGSETRRVDLVFGIGYEDDVDAAEKILREVVGSHPMVLKDPEPTIALDELADSSVNFVVRPWIDTREGDYMQVKWDITREVKKRFDAANISIPFPQTDVHVHQAA